VLWVWYLELSKAVFSSTADVPIGTHDYWPVFIDGLLAVRVSEMAKVLSSGDGYPLVPPSDRELALRAQ